MSLLSGVCLSVGFPITCLGFRPFFHTRARVMRGDDPQEAAFDFEGDDVPEHDEEQAHDEEAQDVNAGVVPLKPSAAEVGRHRISHHPYRRWCRECLEGQAIGEGHRASPSNPLYPGIGVDYFFVTKGAKLIIKG